MSIKTSTKTRRGRLKDIAQSMGETIEDLVPRVVQEEGTAMAAARRLGVSSNTILYWLKKLGYEARFNEPVTWEKTEEGGDE